MNNNFIKKLNQQFETKSQSKVMQYSCFPWKSRLSVEVSTHPKVKKHCSKNWKPMHCVFGEYDGVPSPRQSQQLQRLVLGKNDGMPWTKEKDKDGKDVTEEFLKMHIPQKIPMELGLCTFSKRITMPLSVEGAVAGLFNALLAATRASVVEELEEGHSELASLESEDSSASVEA